MHTAYSCNRSLKLNPDRAGTLAMSDETHPNKQRERGREWETEGGSERVREG